MTNTNTKSLSQTSEMLELAASLDIDSKTLDYVIDRAFSDDRRKISLELLELATSITMDGLFSSEMLCAA
jgi:hypothetical protein